MTKILKKVQLSTEQSAPNSADPTKGTQTNPYTQKEMAILQEEGAWNGGYVEGMGYLVPIKSGIMGSYGSLVPYISSGNHEFEENLEFIHSNSCNPCPKVNFRVEWGNGYPENFDSELLEGLPLSQITVYSPVYSSGVLPFKLSGDNTDTRLIVDVEPVNSLVPTGNWFNDFNGNYSIKGSFKYNWELKGENGETIMHDDDSGINYLNGKPLINDLGQSISQISGEETHSFSYVVISSNF